MQSTGHRRPRKVYALGAVLVLSLIAGPAAVQADSHTSDDSKSFEVKYKNGLQFNRKDGSIKLKLGGRMQWDVAGVMVDDALRAAVGGDGSGVECRRCRLYLSGKLYDRVIFKAQYDFAGSNDKGNTAFKDVYLGLTDLGPVGTVKIGNMKEPFSLEELMSSKYITFMERGLPALFDSSRNVGIAASNHHLDDRLTWGLGVFYPSNDGGFSFDDATGVNLTGRLTGLPLYSDDGKSLVHLGVSLSQQFRDDAAPGEATTRYRQRPESHLTKRFVDTGSVSSEGNTLLAVEGAWVGGPFSLQAEYKTGWVDRVGDTIAQLQGVYVQGSWFLTGEHRPYKTSSGIFGRVSPTKSFNPVKGDWGAFEVAVRYSWLDLNDSGLNGGKQQDVTVGLNWYLYSALRLTMNYVWADVQDTGANLGNASGNINIIEARAQLEF